MPSQLTPRVTFRAVDDKLYADAHNHARANAETPVHITHRRQHRHNKLPPRSLTSCNFLSLLLSPALFKKMEKIKKGSRLLLFCCPQIIQKGMRFSVIKSSFCLQINIEIKHRHEDCLASLIYGLIRHLGLLYHYRVSFVLDVPYHF
jgi:hypothetical protein